MTDDAGCPTIEQFIALENRVTALEALVHRLELLLGQEMKLDDPDA